MKLTVISTTKHDSDKEKQLRQLQQIFYFFGETLDITYVYDPKIINKVTVDGNGSIVQSSLLDDFTGKPDWVHVWLTNKDWRKIKLRSSQWGEHQTVSGVAITYGRWYDGMRGGRARYYEKEMQSLFRYFGKKLDDLHEHVAGMVHEFIHSREGYVAVAHSYLYGYDKLYYKWQERILKPKRNYQNASMVKAIKWVLQSKVNRLLAEQALRIKTVVTPKTIWEKLTYFKQSEFDHPEKMQDKMLLALDKVRKDTFPIKINSDWRTTGSHASGYDIDIDINGGTLHSYLFRKYNKGEGKKWWDYLKAKYHPKYAKDRQYQVYLSAVKHGFNRIGFYNGHMHLGMDPNSPQNVVWAGLSK